MMGAAQAFALAAVLAALGLSGCRHVVVERNFGRMDGDLGISTNSDPYWKIEREPDKAPPEAAHGAGEGD
jgi:hypothetical protein